MKILSILGFILLFHQTGNAQLTPLRAYRTDKFKDDFGIFKIRGKRYYTDFSKRFFSKRNSIFTNETDDIVYFMVYNKKYLFVAYYPQNEKLWALGFEFRAINRVRVFKLTSPHNKWTYKFEDKTSLTMINSFNSMDGKIIFHTTEQILPVSTESSEFEKVTP